MTVTKEQIGTGFGSILSIITNISLISMGHYLEVFVTGAVGALGGLVMTKIWKNFIDRKKNEMGQN